MDKGLVTIAIPAYKTEFLYQTIASAMLQTYTNIEVIVVDDKSPHNVKAVLDQFNDKRLRYHRNMENLGAKDPAGNWNKCLSLAHGEYFALLCDDDIYEPTFIQTLISLAAEHPTVNVFRARCAIVDESGGIEEMFPSSPLWETSEDYMWHVFKGLRRQTISEFLYRSDYIKKSGGYVRLPFAWNADYVSVFNFSMEGGIVSTNSILVKFRMSGMNISSRTKENGEAKLLANNEALHMATRLIKKSQCEYKKMLLCECAKWKYHLDRDLISSLGIREGIHAFLSRKKYDVGVMVFVKGLILALINRLNREA
jgi:glycosyltransferase involved in cell wall biosynthesis